MSDKSLGNVCHSGNLNVQIAIEVDKVSSVDPTIFQAEMSANNME